MFPRPKAGDQRYRGSEMICAGSRTAPYWQQPRTTLAWQAPPGTIWLPWRRTQAAPAIVKLPARELFQRSGAWKAVFSPLWDTPRPQ